MNKIIIATLALLAGSAAVQASVPDCNPAIGNWVNAAPTTCRFISKDKKEPIAFERPVSIDIPEIEIEIPTEDVPE